MNTSLLLFQQGMWLVISLSAPALICATLCGVVVSLIQAITQIQDQSLPYIAKLVTVSVVLALLGKWMGSQLIDLLNAAFVLTPTIGH